MLSGLAKHCDGNGYLLLLIFRFLQFYLAHVDINRAVLAEIGLTIQVGPRLYVVILETVSELVSHGKVGPAMIHHLVFE